MFNISAVPATRMILDSPKNICTYSPAPANVSFAKEIPRPSASDVPHSSMLRLVNLLLDTRLMPDSAIIENTTIVAPPITQFGMVDNSADSFGQNAATTRVTAAHPMTNLLHTLVRATIPEHWL